MTLEITGRTQLAAVIGTPVRHSLSPAIINAGFAAAELDWRFVAFDVAAERGAAALDGMRALGIGGLSVTMPHKAVAAAAVDVRTPVAEALGAVNCVFWDDELLVGDSTDGPGFVDALRIDEGIDVAGLRCIVLGAGGAGRAVAFALADAQAAEVVIVNRSPGPAQRSAELAGPVGRVGRVEDIPAAELVVNATPLGMAGARAGDDAAPPLPFDPDLLQSGQIVADLVYHPLVTPLLAAATERGGRAVQGLGMLVHQAAHAFRRWTGEDPPFAAMAAAAVAELDRRATSSEFDATPRRDAT